MAYYLLSRAVVTVLEQSSFEAWCTYCNCQFGFGVSCLGDAILANFFKEAAKITIFGVDSP